MDNNENELLSFCNKPIEREERISRFIFNRRYCKDGNIKPAAFQPHSISLETSVYRTDNLSEDVIWEIDNKYVGGIRGEPSLGRADLKAKDILDNGLTIDPNGIPHPRHADIRFNGLDKDKQKLASLKLALASRFVQNQPNTAELSVCPTNINSCQEKF